jgi:hypothetical protein
MASVTGGTAVHIILLVRPTSAQLVTTAMTVIISSTLSHTPMPLILRAIGLRLHDESSQIVQKVCVLRRQQQGFNNYRLIGQSVQHACGICAHMRASIHEIIAVV